MLPDHPLLIESLKVADDLGNHADQLARDVSDVLLRQLPLLLSPAGQAAERRLELRRAKWRPETALAELTLAVLAQALLTQALLTQALLTETLPAQHGGVLQLRLVLQHPNDLWHDRQQLADHFVDILLAQLPRCLAECRVADCPVRLLCLRQDLRQRRHQLPYHLIHILLRKLALLLTAPLSPLRLLLAPAERGDAGLTAILAVLLAICRLPLAVTALSITAKSMAAHCLHQRHIAPGAIGLAGLAKPLRIELRMRGILLLDIEVSHRLISLRWLMPSAHHERRRCVLVFALELIFATERLQTSAPTIVSTHARARARLLNRDQSIGNRFAQKEFSPYPLTSLSRP